MVEENRDERVYVIPLSRAKRVSNTRRSAVAVKTVRNFILKHAKSGEVKIDGELNKLLWERGIKNPPKSVEGVDLIINKQYCSWLHCIPAPFHFLLWSFYREV